MKRNYWPFFFMGIFGFTFAMIVWTVYSATKVPVHKDDSFLSTYANVDEDFNKIVFSNELFKSKYDISILLNGKPVKLDIKDIYFGQRVLEKDSDHKDYFLVGKNRLEIIIKDKNGNIINNANIDLKVTVPTNFDHEIIMDKIEFSNNTYSKEFEIPNQGNWNMMGKIEVNENTGYLILKSNAIK